MPIKRLTEEGVAKLKSPTAGQVDYYDAGMPGLVLRVNYGGAKVWRALYYIKKTDANGKRLTLPTTKKLGLYPRLKLKDAREKARQFLVDPQKAMTQADDGTFKDVAENFIKRYVIAEKALRTRPEIERVLKKYIYPQWQYRPFREIGRRDVAALLDKIVDDNGPRQADAALAIIRKMMNWFATRDDYYVSPVVKGMHRNNSDDRSRTLNDDEIRALWKAADGTFGALLKVALLTAQRREKVGTMKWDNIVDSVWTIDSEEREKSNAGRLPLPQAAIDIIEAQPRISGNPYVFAAGKGKGRFNSFSQRKEEIDAKLPDMRRWTTHDLRRTARSLLSRADVRPDISERVLGHAIKGVEGVYDRYAYTEEKGQALAALASLIENIINPSPAKVTRLAEHRKRRKATR